MNLASLSSIVIGLETLRGNPLRTVLSTLGIIIGAASLVAVLSLGDGLERFGRQQIERTTDLQSVVIQSRTSQFIDGQSFPIDSYPVFTADEAGQLLRAIPEASGASITVMGTSPLTAGEDSSDVTVIATLAGAAEFLEMRFDAGRYFTEAEARGNEAVVVVSHALAQRVGGGRAEDAVGRSVRLRGRDRRVIGVRAAIGAEQGGTVFVPLEAQGDALRPTPRPRAPDLILKARTVEAVPEVERRVTEWLAARYPNWQGVARVTTNRARLRQVSQGMLVFKGFMGALTGISLLVGGIGIMNVLLAAVTERTREIGIRKAIGARRLDVLLQFLAESVAISGLGSLFGAGLGLAGAFGVTAVIRAKSEAQVYAAFTWGTVTLSVLAALLVGMAFGMYPALRASRLSPIDAIRHE